MRTHNCTTEMWRKQMRDLSHLRKLKPYTVGEASKYRTSHMARNKSARATQKACRRNWILQK